MLFYLFVVVVHYVLVEIYHSLYSNVAFFLVITVMPNAL
jgi:hypothetical protein